MIFTVPGCKWIQCMNKNISRYKMSSRELRGIFLPPLWSIIFSFLFYFSEFNFKRGNITLLLGKRFKLKYLHILCFGFIVTNITEMFSVPVTLTQMCPYIDIYLCEKKWTCVCSWRVIVSWEPFCGEKCSFLYIMGWMLQNFYSGTTKEIWFRNVYIVTWINSQFEEIKYQP